MNTDTKRELVMATGWVIGCVIGTVAGTLLGLYMAGAR